jgi:hypothetical protein
MRWIWVATMFSCVAIGGCPIDSRDFQLLESGLTPAGEGSGGGLLVLPSSVAYGPVALAFGASARFLVENTGGTTLQAPRVSLEGNGDNAFILTQNGCTAALPRGAYCEVAVVFRPNDLSTREATLTISGSGGNFEIPLSGSGLEPGGLLLSAVQGGEVRFGDVPLEGEREATLQLSNPTAASAGPVGLISNNAAVRLVPARGNECASSGAQLAAGQSCNFRVRFTPVLRGVTDATITARSPDAGSVSLSVSGRALAPARLLIDPAQLDFGDVVVAGAAVLDLAISNVGDEPLPPVTSSVRGEAASDFRVSENGCSTPLPTRETCSLSVSFSPRATGPHAAVLDLDAGIAGLLGVDLSGAGLAAGNLLVAAADGADGDFGSVALGGESERSFRISNTSNEPSGPITFATNSGDFSLAPAGGADCFSGVTDLAGGASCQVRVRFAPTQRSQRNATLTVSSGLGSAALNLSGVGLAPAVIVTDGAVDFGGISRGGTALSSVTVTNPGDEPVAALSARVAGLDATSFSVQSNGCMSGLEAQGSCVISVVFAPTATGSLLGTLTIEGEAGDSHDVTLSGTGLAPALLGIEPSQLVFGPVAVGRVALSALLTVTNRGDTTTERVNASITAATPSFSITPGTCSAALASGESCTLNVTFAPSVVGLHPGSLRVTSTPAGTLEVPVNGTGTLGPGDLSSNLIMMAMESTYFGSVAIGGSVTRPFTLRNTGDFSAGTLVGVTVPDGVFSVAPPVEGDCQPGVTLLDARASCNFRIIYAPIVTGSSIANLTVSSTTGGATTERITGTGTL